MCHNEENTLQLKAFDHSVVATFNKHERFLIPSQRHRALVLYKANIGSF